MGTLGTFGMALGPNVNKPHEVQPSFNDPILTGHKILWMIYPSHQVCVPLCLCLCGVGEFRVYCGFGVYVCVCECCMYIIFLHTISPI